MLSIDWLGMTATVLVDYAVTGIIIVDSDGIATLLEQIDMNVMEIDLVQFVMWYFGPNLGPLLLEELLELRHVMLAKQQFEDAMDEYMERNGG